jgi:hypothetical protein
MNQVEWYYARDNKQNGPVSAVELKRLATAGEIKPDDLVWREGMAEWSPAKNVRGLFDEEGRAGGPADAAAATPGTTAADHAASGLLAEKKAGKHLFDKLIDRHRQRFDAKFIESTSKFLRQCGSYGLFVAAALAAIFYTILVLKSVPDAGGAGPMLPSSGILILTGIASVVILITLQYVAERCCKILRELNDSVSGSLSSTVVPDCLVVLSKMAGIVILLDSIAMAIQISQFLPIFPGIVIFLICVYLSIIAMNPAALNISISPEPLQGGEMIGVVTFLLKALMRLAPAAFGIGVACGTLSLGCLCCVTFTRPTIAWMNVNFVEDALILSASLPLAAYLLFLIVNLILNIWRSVLSLPQKLDKIAEKPEKQEERQE